MQKCNLDFSLLKFKMQIKIQHKELLTFILLRLNPFGLRVDREGWWFEHSVS